MFLDRSPQCPNQVLVLRNLQDKTSVLTRWHLEVLSYVDNLEPATGKVMQTNEKPAAEKFRCGLSTSFVILFTSLTWLFMRSQSSLKKSAWAFSLRKSSTSSLLLTGINLV